MIFGKLLMYIIRYNMFIVIDEYDISNAYIIHSDVDKLL